MLNELCQLADALENAGITPKEWCSQLKQLPKITFKEPCYRIWISADNTISSIDEMPNNLAAVLRKWEPSNGNSFPAFNIQPLYRITSKEQKVKLKEWRGGKTSIAYQELRSWCTNATDNWDRKIQKKLKICLNEIPLKLNQKMNSVENHEQDSIQELIRRASRYTGFDMDFPIVVDAKNFRQSMESFIWKSLSQGERVNTLLSILFCEGDSTKRPEEDQGRISVFLDIDDWQCFGYPVAHEKSLDSINDRLRKNDRKIPNSTLKDAFGLPFFNVDDKLPSVKLPIIADVKLRSMFSAHHCQYRYGKIEADSFPISMENRTKAKGALEWLCDPSREGQTWGRADNKELIFAYPSALQEIIPMASIFIARNIDGTAEARFSDAAKDVIAALTKLTTNLRSLELRVFALKKMDKARTKVAFYRNYSAQRLVDAANDWQVGCTNLPELRLKVWTDQKGEWKTTEPTMPYPLQLGSCLNRIWKLDGSSECETKSVPSSQGIELLLDEQAYRFIPHLLAVLLQNSKGLLLSLGNEQSKGTPASIKGKDSQKLLIPSLLGLLLHKLGIHKEAYMTNTPFLVGRILKLSDELHAFYCQEVRNNNLPPQLVGNSLMVAALESPTQALAQLSMRLNPYLAWAKQFRTKNETTSWKADWLLKLFEETTSSLTDAALPYRCTDTEKAQMFIGYLSSLTREQDVSTQVIASKSN